jgi:integrase
MNSSELAAMLEMMAGALRAATSSQAPQATPQPTAPGAAGRTFGQWLDVHEREIQQRGYKAQTLKNRRSVIEHCRNSAKPGPYLLRKAGGGAIEQSSLSARFHEHICAVLGDAAHKHCEWPSLHECRSLAARLYDAQGVDVQTLLGHKAPEMTAVYTNDRGLSAKDWKRVEVTTPVQA